MRKFIKLSSALIGTLAIATCFTSCAEFYDSELPAEETYTREFIKAFGLIDPNQDWNMATRASVTVNTESPTDVQVYALYSGRYRLLGDFSNVSGTQALQFDMPRGVNDILVRNGSTAVKASLGGNASLLNSSATRSISTHTSTDNSLGVTVEQTDDYVEFASETDKANSTGVYEYRQKLPESKNNVNKVTDNFTFYSGDENYSFVIYPVYWNTSNVVEIGLCTTTASANNTSESSYSSANYVPIYTNKSGEQLYASNGDKTNVKPEGSTNAWIAFYKKEGTTNFSQSKCSTEIYDCENLSYTDENGETVKWPVSTTDGNYSNLTAEQKSQLSEFIPAYLHSLNEAYTYESNSFAWNVYNITLITQIMSEWAIPNTWGEETTETKLNDKTITKFRSRGIKVTVPANTFFNIYAKENRNENIFYSESEKNETNGTGGTSTEGIVHIPHMGTFINNAGVRCMGFEDWAKKYDSEEPDLNDLIIYTTLATADNGGEEKIIDEDKVEVSWILAAEDLGSTDDFDFNDMVIKVQKRKSTTSTIVDGKVTDESSSYWLDIEALAAGGTLPLKLCNSDFNVKKVEGQDYYEYVSAKNASTEVLSSPIEGASNPEQFHSWFGNGNISTGTMINTFSKGTTGGKISVELTKDQYDTFSMSSFAKYSTTNENSTESKMGGFYFLVQRNNSDGTADNTYYTTNQVIAPADPGAAPQMICVPDTWRWPVERTDIREAYTGFAEWVGDATKHTWVSTGKEDLLVK